MSKILFIGLDHLAAACAKRLHLAGHSVSVAFSDCSDDTLVELGVARTEDYYLALQETDFCFLGMADVEKLHHLFLEDECLLNAFQKNLLILSLFPYPKVFWEQWAERCHVYLSKGYWQERYIELFISYPAERDLSWVGCWTASEDQAEKLSVIFRALKLSSSKTSYASYHFLEEASVLVAKLEARLFLEDQKVSYGQKKRYKQQLSYAVDIFKLFSLEADLSVFRQDFLEKNLKKREEIKLFLD